MLLKDNIRRFLNNRMAVLGGAILAVIVALALLAPVICVDPMAVAPVQRLRAPDAEHLFGTDTYGRDLFSRVVYGARVSMQVGLWVVGVSLVLGVTLGLIAGYFKAADGIIMRVCDSLKAIPSVLLAIALMAFLGASTLNVTVALIIVYTPDIVRQARSSTLVAREQPYVEAMRAAGAGAPRIMAAHILPNILSPIIIQASYVFASTIVTEAALSFMGVGVPAPAPSWGNILYEGKSVISKAWWMIVFPGAATALSVLGLSLLGDGIRDALDPKG